MLYNKIKEFLYSWQAANMLACSFSFQYLFGLSRSPFDYFQRLMRWALCRGLIVALWPVLWQNTKCHTVTEWLGSAPLNREELFAVQSNDQMYPGVSVEWRMGKWYHSWKLNSAVKIISVQCFNIDKRY